MHEFQQPFKNVNFRRSDNPSRRTPLHIAFRFDHLDAVRLFLEAERNTQSRSRPASEQKDIFGRTPVFYAASVEALELYLERGGGVDDVEDGTGRTLLHHFAARSRKQHLITADLAERLSNQQGVEDSARLLPIEHGTIISSSY